MTGRLLVLLFLIFSHGALSQVPGPEQFLGYPVGTHFTPHWKIIDYFRAVANASPATVKLENYGQTNEGRPLMVAFVSTAENISRLEDIRKNNLRLAGLLNDQVQASTNAPAIVWFSYNVHGNEPSSSEAAMQVLYTLANPAGSPAKEWLKNTVVIIDPCLNPDGRDRYVNWENSVLGAHYDPSAYAREHREPWPGGRTNHYYFDLNRDWAWQTQVESQQRLKLYNRWLPQIHVDFHEQDVNDPYYFAPAAQPYHEVITPWQRQFQEEIGHNHAKYFDQQGWLYFTKEVFDLLYPSYGDTYPLYNGAIGMTYEQGGGPRGGLAALTNTGDTLRLTDRVLHHFTTSLSTLETASDHAPELISHYRDFYSTAATTGVGAYRSFIIKTGSAAPGRVEALIRLLNNNQIQYFSVRPGRYTGFNYDNGRDEKFTADSGDLLVPSIQPKSTLVKVLFEPKAVLVDSATYDITAWSLPYVYGMGAYATKQAVPVAGAFHVKPVTLPENSNPYGYVIRWTDVSSVALVSSLLQKGVRLRYTEEPFQMGGQQFGRGSVIVLHSGNQSVPGLWQMVREEASRQNVPLFPVNSGMAEKGYDFGSSRVHALKPRRIAMLTGQGINSNAAGEVWFYFDKLIAYPVTLINADEVGRVNWNDFDVLIMPDGQYGFLNDKNQAEEFHSWVSNGGSVVAMEGAVAQLAKQDWSLKVKKEDADETDDIYGALKKYESRERDMISNTTPGSIFRVELDNTHPLAFGYPAYYYSLKQDDRVYEFLKDDGWNVGVIKKDNQVSGFVGARLQPKLQDGLIFGVQEIGRGTITYLADDILFRSFWENGKLMFANSVFLVGQLYFCSRYDPGPAHNLFFI
jgi:hypothetical protein